MLSEEDRVVIEILRVEKRYSAKKLMADFREKKLISCFCEPPATPD